MAIELDEAALSGLEASLADLRKTALDVAGKAGALLDALAAHRAGTDYVPQVTPALMLEMKESMLRSYKSYGAGNRQSEPFCVAYGRANPTRSVDAILVEMKHGLPDGTGEHYMLLVADQVRGFGLYLRFCRTESLDDDALVAAGRMLRQELEDGRFAARRPDVESGGLLPPVS